MLFSQRMEITPLPAALRPDAMPDALRNSLWNVFDTWRKSHDERGLLNAFWHDFFKEPLDTIPHVNNGFNGANYRPAWQKIRDRFFRGEWYEVFDIIQFCLENHDRSKLLVREINTILKRELAAYRAIDGQIAPVTDPSEVEALTIALAERGRFAPVSEHLSTALRLLSDRSYPDCRNLDKGVNLRGRGNGEDYYRQGESRTGRSLGGTGKEREATWRIKSRLEFAIWLYERCGRTSPRLDERIKSDRRRGQVFSSGLYVVRKLSKDTRMRLYSSACKSGLNDSKA